jgi:hypothetical protein
MQSTAQLLLHTAAATIAALLSSLQTLLNANVTQLSTLRYGDAKTLPAVDVLLQPGYDEVVKKLLPGLAVRYNSSEQRGCGAL